MKPKPDNLYRWNSLTEEEWEQIASFPKWLCFPGTYVFFSKGQCLYVGQSKNIRKRLVAHSLEVCRYTCAWETPWGQFNNLKISFKKESKLFERLMTEARLIDRLKPKFNKINGIGFNKNG